MLKVRIRYSLEYDSMDILFIEQKEDGIRYIANPIKLNFTEHKIGDRIEPTLQINREIAPEFLKALAEALDEQGVKTENDFKIQGLLEATKSHLEDMRKIVFKDYR